MKFDKDVGGGGQHEETFDKKIKIVNLLQLKKKFYFYFNVYL